MQWDIKNTESELRWFFQDAYADCGVRSSQGGFEAQMEARALVGRAEGPCMHVKESYSRREDDCITERQLQAFGKARKIYQRLNSLPSTTQRILEAQYGCTRCMGDISLTLASLQPAAISGHQSAVAASHAAYQRRLEDAERRKSLGQKQRGKSQVKPKKRIPTSASVRDWLLFLCSNDEARVHLAPILDQARKQLKLALDAYLSAEPCVQQ